MPARNAVSESFEDIMIGGGDFGPKFNPISKSAFTTNRNTNQIISIIPKVDDDEIFIINKPI